MLRRYAGDRRYGLVMPRAAALQLLHPAIAAAAVEHHRYAGSLWRQQARAVPRAVAVVYRADAAARVRRAHRRVAGQDHAGRRYDALAPDVFFWEHATYVDALMTMIDLFDRPLTPDGRERLYQECRVWYRRYGVSERGVPPDHASFTRYFAEVCADVLEASPALEEYREQLLHPDVWLPRLLPEGLVPALLPERARDLLDLTVTPSDERRLRAYARTVGTAWPLLPRSVRRWPAAR
ncbi:hypothetical protein GCM10022221_64070 [Actinocorallia aurea]